MSALWNGGTCPAERKAVSCHRTSNPDNPAHRPCHFFLRTLRGLHATRLRGGHDISRVKADFSGAGKKYLKNYSLGQLLSKRRWQDEGVTNKNEIGRRQAPRGSGWNGPVVGLGGPKKRKKKTMKSRPKLIPALADLVATAWNDNAPDTQFAGMTLTQFRTAIKGSADTRGVVLSLSAQRRAKLGEREAADATTRDAVQRVVSAVRSDPAHGPDSPLLTAMGYVTRSARKSGKTNKSSDNSQQNGKVAAVKA